MHTLMSGLLAIFKFAKLEYNLTIVSEFFHKFHPNYNIGKVVSSLSIRAQQSKSVTLLYFEAT